MTLAGSKPISSGLLFQRSTDSRCCNEKIHVFAGQNVIVQAPKLHVFVNLGNYLDDEQLRRVDGQSFVLIPGMLRGTAITVMQENMADDRRH